MEPNEGVKAVVDGSREAVLRGTAEERGNHYGADGLGEPGVDLVVHEPVRFTYAKPTPMEMEDNW